MTMQFYTYLHCKPDGAPFYVGKGSGRRSHEWTCRHQHHRNVIAKYGKANIGVFVFPCDSEHQALDDEVQQIAQLRRDGYGLVNITEGGDGALGYRHSPETLAKMSAGNTGKTRTPEHCAKLSRAWRPASPETLLKIAAANTGKRHSLETRAKMSAALAGHALSAETRAKISVTLLGNTYGLGRKQSAETRAKISASHKARRKLCL